jgi:hypothetical protein
VLYVFLGLGVVFLCIGLYFTARLAWDFLSLLNHSDRNSYLLAEVEYRTNLFSSALYLLAAVLFLPLNKRKMPLALKYSKLMLGLSILCLNLYFAWTAHVFDLFSVNSSVNYFLFNLYEAMYTPGSFIFNYSVNFFVLSDLTVVILFSGVVLFSLVVFKGSRTLITALKTLRVASVAVLPLGVEILLLDRSELFFYTTTFQGHYHFLTWFTNADLLGCCVGVAVFSTLLLRWFEGNHFF